MPYTGENIPLWHILIRLSEDKVHTPHSQLLILTYIPIKYICTKANISKTWKMQEKW